MWDHPLLSDLFPEIAKSKENILFGSSLYFIPFFFFFSMYGKLKQK